MRVLLVLFAWVILGLSLASRPTPDPEADATHIPQLERVLEGRLFQAAPGRTLLLPAYDPGMFAIPSVVLATARATIAPAWQPGLELWTWLQYALYALAVWILCLPAVPLRLSIGAVVFLVGHVACAGSDPLGGLFAPHYYGYWAPPLACLVTLVWLLSLASGPRPGASGLVVAAGSFVGVLGTWRVDAALIPALAAIAFAGWALATRAGRGVVLACALFVVLTRGPDLALRGALFAHQAATGVEHFQASGGVRGHMVWHNLYLSYASVPLAGPRAEWDDEIGWLHACEYRPRLTCAGSAGKLSSEHDQALFWLYVTTALERPLMWLEALGTRAVEVANLCWPSLVLGFLWGPLRLRRARHPALWAAAVALLAASALPPLLYSALPWYARAVQTTARALPWLAALAAVDAVPAGTAPLAPEFAVARRAGVYVAAALAIVAGLGQACTLAYERGLAHLDLAGWTRRFAEDPRHLRSALAAIPAATRAALADQTRRAHGVVQGGGQLDHRGADAPARLVSLARVGLHLVLWLEGTAPWPGRGAPRDLGGWVEVELGDARYRMRVPRFERGESIPVMIPVAPADDAPVSGRVYLRDTTGDTRLVSRFSGLRRLLDP